LFGVDEENFGFIEAVLNDGLVVAFRDRRDGESKLS
jgi:hypothetical protein